LKTIADVLVLSTRFLEDHHVERPRRTAEELLSHVLGLKRMELYMQFDRPLIEEEMTRMRLFLKRSVTKEPVAYILGSVEFYGCLIDVTPDVLIPRPETEILVDLAVKKILISQPKGKFLWDLCTGSGCIGLSIKRACPDLTVVLSDISPKAVDVAEQNIRKNHLHLECRTGDLLSCFANEKADFVICNPPYVSKEEYAALDACVRDFEPRTALMGGDSGLEFYERLAIELPAFLNPGAQLFLEIGYCQGSAVQKVFNCSPWCHFQLLKDWAGHDRFFFLEIE
jgi:release factor glutamine methyltransferase